ncbi:DUF3817 domain-containing protein [Membranihabitans maritimus]|uniref:DUF3817 domain-containing protein n=1 Tax=Membranihabitans maritimus TaxID=2904244 RepID=UPI0034E218D6
MINTHIGRLRILGFLEGSSLLVLLFIAMPLKYIWDNPVLVEIIGMIHGLLFLLFICYTIFIAIERKWKFFSKTFKILVSSFIPFGTFYIDHTILKKEMAK